MFKVRFFFSAGSVLLMLLVFNSCTNYEHTKDLSSIELELELVRFEQDLFACKSVDDIMTLAESDPQFYDIYTGNIVAANVQRMGSTPADVAVELYKYISHPDMDSLYSLTQQSYADFGNHKGELEIVAKYIAYYFPEDEITQLTTFVSTFQYGAVYDQENKSFGVGLDMYLGRNFEVYAMLNPQNFPAYRINKFEPYRITPNCVQSYVEYKVPTFPMAKFIDQAVAEGKKLYLLDLLLPTHHDSLKINYMDGQIEWCEDQEENIWKYLIEEEVLFSSDKNEFQRHYFNEGPFTTPFGNESPPRTGAWVGWQIVRRYMKANPKVSIQELLVNRNHQAIFQGSGYRP